MRGLNTFSKNCLLMKVQLWAELMGVTEGDAGNAYAHDEYDCDWLSLVAC